MAQQLPQIHSVHSSQRRPAHGSARPAAPSLLSRVPWGFLAVIAVLVAYGLVVCWSAVQGDADYNFTRQLQGVAVGRGHGGPVGLRLPAPFEPHHGAARHQRGAHPSAPHSGPRHRRGHGGEVLDQDRHAGAARRVREGHGGALRREPSGPLPGHAGRLARVLQGARDAARSVRGHHDPAGFGHGSGVPGHLGGGARHGRRQGALPAASRLSPASRPSRPCSPSTSC